MNHDSYKDLILEVSRGDLLRFVPNIKNGVEIKFHCDTDSLGQMWLIGIGH